jgi:hypothetical protein
MGAPDFILEVLPREEPFKHYEIKPPSNAGTRGQNCGWIGGDEPLIQSAMLQSAILSSASAAETGLKGVAGIDRVTILPGKTYLRGWAGYGDPPRSNQNRGRQEPPPPPAPTGLAYTASWTKDSGPGEVKFADPKALITTAAFSTPGAYVLRLTVDNGQSKSSSSLNVSVETPPPAKQLDAVYTKNFKINSPLWSARAKTLMVSWIPHCIDQINRSDLKQGPGGIDNFVKPERSFAANRMARIKDMCSPTPGCIRPWKP